ncbi:MAG: phage portal protein family protein [Candidatus Thorarchaeota archaeon]|jgi:hypothetical protein
MATILTAKEIKKQYGYSREELLAFEAEQQISVLKTGGGQRRYHDEEIGRLAKGIRRRAAMQEFGTTGLNRFGGSVFEDRTKELSGRAGFKTYREMRLNDPVISALFFALTHSLKQAGWRVKSGGEGNSVDQAAAEFADSCLSDMSFTWSDTFTFIVDPLFEQGFSLLELVYKKRLGERLTQPGASSKFNDRRIGWRKWATRPALSLMPGNEWVFDEHDGIQGVWQAPETGAHTDPVFIPIEKLLHFRTSVHPANTPQPPPIHRAAYWPYWFSQNMQEIEGIGVERDLTGIPVIYLGADCTVQGTNSDYQMALNLVQNIRVDEQVGVVIPKSKMGDGAVEGQGMLLELLSSNSRRSHNIGEIIERYDKRKAVVVLAQFILLGMDRVGSFALSTHQGDLFNLAAEAWIISIADVFNTIAIPRLIKMNFFPGLSGMPEMVPSTVGIPDLKTIGEYVNSLVDKEVLRVDDELESHLRQIARLPQREHEVRISDEEGDEVEKVILSKQGDEALAIVDQLEADLGEIWTEAESSIADGMEVAVVVAILISRFENVMEAAMLEVWLLGVEDFEPGQLAIIEEALGEQLVFLEGFTDELEAALALGVVAEVFESNRSRFLMYAGAVWALFNQGKTYGQPNGSIWKWSGPVDSNTCAVCADEVAAGPRPLVQITRFPGVDTFCLTRCRHELVRVRSRGRGGGR